MAKPYIYRLIKAQTLIKEPDPDSLAQPAYGFVAIKSLYTAISSGTELAAWNGASPLRPTANPYPRLMGYCHVGEVTAVGNGVNNIEVGQHVLSHTAHRSHAHLETNEILCTIDKTLNPIFASTTYLFHLGYAACLKAGGVLGQSIAILGLGTLGLTTAAVAHMGGGKVIAISDHLPCSDLQRDFGINQGINKSEAQLDALNQFDIVITTSSTWDDWKLALQLARRGGQIIVMGFPGRDQPLPNFNPLTSEFFYDKQLQLAACGYMPNYDGEKIDIQFTTKRNCSYLLDQIAAAKLPANKLVKEVCPADNLSDIYDNMSKNRTTAQTIILDWRK